jgi:hypothetical protein
MNLEIPDDVWILILKNLDIRISINFASVSSHFYRFVCHSVTTIMPLFNYLAHNESYKKLQLVNIDDDFIQRFIYLNDLSSMSIISITNKSIQKLKNITSLNLCKYKGIDDYGIQHLNKIQFLNLRLNDCITDTCLKCLTTLTKLDISENMKITDEGISDLINLDLFQIVV